MKITNRKDIKDINKFTGICLWSDGDKYWYKNGKLHREDGPAVENTDGTKSWWIKDIKYTREDYYKELFKLGKITEEEWFLALL